MVLVQDVLLGAPPMNSWLIFGKRFLATADEFTSELLNKEEKSEAFHRVQSTETSPEH